MKRRLVIFLVAILSTAAALWLVRGDGTLLKPDDAAVTARGAEIYAEDCASCHGVHDILPSTDSSSTIHPDNLVGTCGECHPGASANFAAGKIHAGSGDSDEDHLFVAFARTFYLWLIVVVIGGMGSIGGAIVTGYVLGILEGLTKVFYPEASNIVVFVIMAIVLMLRPAGLFGKEI